LFGWKVRLLTVWLHHNQAPGAQFAGARGWVGQRLGLIGRDIGGTAQEVAAERDGTREFNGTD
jgi:hypothetical protein